MTLSLKSNISNRVLSERDKDLYLSARLAGDRKRAELLKDEWNSPVVSYPVTDALSDNVQNFVDNGVSSIKSKMPFRDGCKDKRFRLDHSPSALANESVLFQVGSQDVLVKHQNINCQWSPSGGAGGGIRGKISELSRKSLDRMKLHARNIPDGVCQAMLTVTYPDEYTTDGKEVKRHLNLLKKWLQRNACNDGFWFLEFQKRGAPHFHIFLKNWPTGGVSAVAHAWHSIVGTDDKKHLEWHLGNLSGTPCLEWLRNPHAASAYVTKYASKKEQKDVPDDYQNVGRFWGYWGVARPVWRFVSGRGSYCVNAAWSVVLTARAVWDDPNSRFKERPMLSTTMWGSAAAFDGLLDDVGWIPF